MSVLILTGTEENVKVAENLQKCWNVIEPNAEQNGLFLFRFVLYIVSQMICNIEWTRGKIIFALMTFESNPTKGTYSSLHFAMCRRTI